VEHQTRKATISSPALENGGKLNPAKLPGSGLKLQKRIVSRTRNGKKVFCVESKDGKRSFGCFTSEAGARRRLGQVEGFAAASKVVKAAVEKKLFVPILKQNQDEQTITGVVLQPEIVDAQGDIIASDVIRKAAHRFLADYNKQTKLGLMHKDFKPKFELYESYIVPMEMVIGTKVVKAGSWVIVVHVLDKNVWKQVKDGKLTGFSIGGKAKVLKLEQKAAA